MVEIISGEALFATLRGAIDAADQARLAIAFWGEGAMDALGLNSGKKVEVICNLGTGGTDPREVEKMIKAGVSVFALDTLHAKMGVVGDLGFLGSSNASSNGLALKSNEISNWHELNATFTDPEIVRKLTKRYETLRGLAIGPLKLGHPALEKAKIAYRNRRMAASGTLIDAVRQNPEFFRGRAYLVCYKELRGEQARAFYKATEAIGDEIGFQFDFYAGWTDLPEDGILVDFAMTSGGRKRFTGFYMRSSEIPDRPYNGEPYQSCIAVKDVLGYAAIGSEDDWSELIDKARERCRPGDDDSICIDLCEAALAWLDD